MPLSASRLPPYLLMPLLFLVNGIFLGMWVASIPNITAELALDHGTAGRVLAMVSVGGLVSFPVVAIVASRLPSRTVLIGFGLLRAATFVLIALASSDIGLAGALIVVGFAHGGLDVALNNQAVHMEKAHGISLLPRAHAAYSIGTLSGSLIAGTLEGIGVSMVGLFLVPMAIAALVFSTAKNGLVPGSPTSGRPAPAAGAPQANAGIRLPLPSLALAVLLIIAFITEIGEEAISDWYAIYLREDLETLPTVSSMDYSVFSFGILLGRLVGDPITRQLTSARVIQLCGGVSGIGMLIGLAGNTAAMMILGTFITGLGFSLLIPTLYREAGSLRSMPSATAMAMMSTSLYLGFMVGPLIIGPFSNMTSLRFALGMVGILYLTLPFWGRVLQRAQFTEGRLRG